MKTIELRRCVSVSIKVHLVTGGDGLLWDQLWAVRMGDLYSYDLQRREILSGMTAEGQVLNVSGRDAPDFIKALK